MLLTNIATPGNPKISENNGIEWTLSFPYETIPTARHRHARGRTCHCYNLKLCAKYWENTQSFDLGNVKKSLLAAEVKISVIKEKGKGEK